jgi:hypothetical protein
MKRLLARFFAPYIISAQWGDRFVHHFAWTRAEALSWMACYPADARVAIFADATGFVAMRRGK